jgi:hypothetical protein
MPIESGFRVRLLSPLGRYPAKSFFSQSAAMIVSPEICFSVVTVRERDWSFSEVDSLTRLELPLYGSFLLAGKPHTPFGYLYPTTIRVDLEADTLDDIAANVLEYQSHLIAQFEKGESDAYHGYLRHKPPILGGSLYDLVDEIDEALQKKLLSLLQDSEDVMLRGLSCLIKAGMAFQYGEFREAACIYLWIALDAAHHIVLDKLRKTGIVNPTSSDAARYFERIPGGFGAHWEHFFEEDYEKRIRAIHPGNRFGAEAIPQFLADDFYELNEMLVPLFEYLVSRQ